MDSSLDEELEAIMAIYIDELKIDEGPDGLKELKILLHPATAEKVDQQYVCITLILQLSKNYPNEVPEISIRNPRGLSDEELHIIENGLMQKAEECEGNEMLYQLIELCKEYLTARNSPSCECSICLYNFLEADVFLKTECYHYFHSYCLASYAVKQNDRPGLVKVILCPVCRAEISYKVPKSKDEFPPPIEEMKDSFEVNDSLLKEHQKTFSKIYEKQKANGGIIDVEAENAKFLLNISAPSEANRIQVTLQESPLAGDQNEVRCVNTTEEFPSRRNQPYSYRKNFIDDKKYYQNRSNRHSFYNTRSSFAKFNKSKFSEEIHLTRQKDSSNPCCDSVKPNSQISNAQGDRKPDSVNYYKTKSYRESHFTKRHDLSHSYNYKNFSANHRVVKDQIYDRQNGVESQNSKLSQDLSSKKQHDLQHNRSDRNVKLHPRTDKGQTYRPSACRSLKPEVVRTNEYSSLSMAESNSNKKTCDVNPNISVSAKNKFDQVSALTASVNELSMMETNTRPPPGFNSHFRRNVRVRPPPGFTSR